MENGKVCEINEFLMVKSRAFSKFAQDATVDTPPLIAQGLLAATLLIWLYTHTLKANWYSNPWRVSKNKLLTVVSVKQKRLPFLKYVHLSTERVTDVDIGM